MYRLIFHNGQFSGRRFAVQQGTLLIGRDPSCEVNLADDDLVSQHHAQLEQRRDGVWLKDLGSMSPTTVNGEVVEEVKLRSGDKIEIGRTHIEFQSIETLVSTSRRRISHMHILALLAVGGILLLEAVFIFVFPIWQRPYLERPKLIALDDADVETNIEQLVTANVGSVSVIGDASPDDTAAAVAPPTGSEAVSQAELSPELEAEVLALKQAVSGLHEQVISLSTQTTAVVASTTADMIVVAPSTATQTATLVVAQPTTSGIVIATAPPAQPQRVVAAVTTSLAAVSTTSATTAAAAPASPPPAVAPPRPTPVDPLAVAARDMLALARSEAQKGNLTAADQALERLLILSPDNVEGLVERARVYERRGQMKEAGAIWARAESLSTNTALVAEARKEQQRLIPLAAVARVEQKSPPSPAAVRPQRRVRITSLDRQRFQGNDEFDEMRIVNIQMRPRREEGPIDAKTFEVRVAFYDRIVGTTRVVLTGATVPTEALHVDSPWSANETKTVTASYILPRNFRAREEARTGEKRIYEGYRVQLWYNGELQDEESLPRTLLKLPMPEFGAPRAKVVPVSSSSLNAPMRR